MGADDLEGALRHWFQRPLPPESDRLHRSIDTLADARPGLNVARQRSLLRWGSPVAASLTVTVVALLIAGSLVPTMLGPGAGPSGHRPAPGTFAPAGSLPSGLGWDTATVMPGGSVLVTGGRNDGGSAILAALYDPASGEFRVTGSLASRAGLTAGRTRATATLLADGRVLLAGGRDDSGRALASAEIYDPATGASSITGDMSVARADQTATLLRDGRVVLVGGRSGPATWGTGYGDPVLLSSAELYDPATGTFVSTGSLATPRADGTATLLADGRVLVAGGVDETQLSSAELYDPRSGKFNSTGSMTIGRQQPTATLLPNGRVLIAGGWSTEGSLSSAELYDPSSATFTSTGSMSEGRYQNAAQLLPGGLVLVVGGECSGDHCGGVSGPLASSELYDPATGTFYPGGQMGQPRYGFASAIVSDGSVLVLGGQNEAGMLQTAEVYRSR